LATKKRGVKAEIIEKPTGSPHVKWGNHQYGVPEKKQHFLGKTKERNTTPGEPHFVGITNFFK